MKTIATNSIVIDLDDTDFEELDSQLQSVGELFDPYYSEPYGGYPKFRETDWMINFANTFLKVVNKVVPDFRLSSDWELFRDYLASRVKGCVKYFVEPTFPYVDRFATVVLSPQAREETIASCFKYMVELHVKRGFEI